MSFVHRQGQKYRQKHEAKGLFQFHNHVHALTMLQLTRKPLGYFSLQAQMVAHNRIYHDLYDLYDLNVIKAQEQIRQFEFNNEEIFGNKDEDNGVDGGDCNHNERLWLDCCGSEDIGDAEGVLAITVVVIMMVLTW